MKFTLLKTLQPAVIHPCLVLFPILNILNRISELWSQASHHSCCFRSLSFFHFVKFLFFYLFYLLYDSLEKYFVFIWIIFLYVLLFQVAHLISKSQLYDINKTIPSFFWLYHSCVLYILKLALAISDGESSKLHRRVRRCGRGEHIQVFDG